MAPGTLPMPPSTCATTPFSVAWMLMEGSMRLKYIPTSSPDSPPSAEAMANTARFTASVSTPICRAASRSCAVARTAQPSLVKRRKPHSTPPLSSPTPAISRSSAPMVPAPACTRHDGREDGSARGSGVNRICSAWSSISPMPMVASNGAMRAEPASGRRPTRSMPMPSSADTASTISTVTGSGVCSRVVQVQPV